MVTTREPHNPIMRSDTARLKMKTFMGCTREFLNITMMTRPLLNTDRMVVMNMRKERML